MILVLGAAGKTGRAVTNALVQQGIAVRAAVRPGSNSQPVHHPLVTRSEVDLQSGEGIPAALDNVDGVYHLAPNVHPDEVGMARRVAEAAGRAGVRRFAFHSVLHPEDASMPHHLRKAAAEQVVRQWHPGATILRPAAYHQNLLGAAMSGRIEVPYSIDAPFTNVDLDDVAAVAAIALTTECLTGQAISLVGPERLSVREQAAIAARVLGRPVAAACIPLDAWADGPGAALTAQARADLMSMFRAYDREGLVDEDPSLATILGRAPTTWAERVGRS